MIEHIQGRPLRSVERVLIESMLKGNYAQPGLDAKLSSCLVEDMQDGGMGSIRFLPSGQPERRFGKTLAQAEYIDDDGVLVSIVINADNKGELFELDFWKVDFSRLRRYPAPSELKVTT